MNEQTIESIKEELRKELEEYFKEYPISEVGVSCSAVAERLETKLKAYAQQERERYRKLKYSVWYCPEGDAVIYNASEADIDRHYDEYHKQKSWVGGR